MTAAAAAKPPPEALAIERRKHPWQVAAAIVVLLLLALLARSLLLNDNLQWSVVGKYLFDEHVLDGVGTTLLLTAICQSLAVAGGIIIAVMRLSGNRFLQIVGGGYLWFFRGTPLLVQLVFWYNFAALFPVIFLGVPYTGLGHAYSTNAIISGFTAAILGFSLHESAYMAEIVRAGILSVGQGQREAALSTGMTEMQAMRRIVLPQAMRVIIPPTGNQAINLLKATALVAFISGGDLLSNVKDIYAVNFAVIPLLVVASIWYLAMVTVASIGQHFIEKYVGKGVTQFGREARTRTVDVDRLAAPGV